jgi:sirohydrochlorin cobaltochelatase
MNSSSCSARLQRDAGLLLVGHGTRFAPGAEEFLELARTIAARVQENAVEPSFLEFAEPSIAQGFARLVERGAKCVVVAPVILFAAGHIREDIPREVAIAASAHGNVPFVQSPHLGCHAALVKVSSQRFRESISAAPFVPPADTELVMVGRGSRDAEATAEMLRFAQLRNNDRDARETHTAFLAMADPPLDHTLERLAIGAPRRIVVQPHLLFAGELLERIGTLVERLSHTHPQIDWRVTDHLGPTALVADAVLDRVSEVAVASPERC